MELNCCKNQSDKKVEQAVEFLKVMSEENRSRIVCILRSSEKCVCEIWEVLNLPQNLVSHHLKVLKDFGLISSRKQGLRVLYKLNQKVVNKYLKLLNRVLGDKNDN